MVKKYSLYSIFVSIWLSMALSSCSLFTPPAIIPCYGHIDSIPLVITNFTQGTSANGINTAWVYVDDNPVGAFQLPCTFPMIATTGQHVVTIFAGVENAGEANNRMQYPFYSSYNLIGTTLTQGATVKFKPVVNYASWAGVKIIEDFEGSTQVPNIHSAPNYGLCDTNMFVVNTPKADVYQGAGSGEVVLTATHPNYFGITDSIDFTNSGQALFLEINYKCNNTFTIGIINRYNNPATTPAVVYIDTSSTWKKMYINLQPTMAASPSPNGYGYYIYFKANLDNGNTVGQVFLDNIKMVRYN
jgi:hypothetical protein